MIPRFKPQYDITDWIAALKPTSGNITRYEHEFAVKFGRKYGVMFSYGRTGIYALLNVWGLKEAEIICPAYTCVVVPNAIVLSGNIPVFVDCEDGGFNMSLTGIREAITEKTRVIIPTHLFGYPMDVETIQEIVEEAENKYGHKIYIIQDCAHGYGAKWQGQLVTKYGDAAIFGSNISKIINSIFGGMVITDDKELVNKLNEWKKKNIIDYGWKKTIQRFLYFFSVNIAFNKVIYRIVNYLERSGYLDHFVKYYDENCIDMPHDWNFAPSEIEARIGLNQLKKYDEIIKTRKNNAIKLIDTMESNDAIWMLPFNDGATYSHLVGVVENRKKWIEKYYRKGIQLGVLIEYSVPEMKAYSKYKKNCPNASKYSRSTINLPIWVSIQ